MNGLGDGVTPTDAAEGPHIQHKEIDFTFKPGICDMLESQEMLIPSEGEFPGNTHFTDIVDSKNVNRFVSSADASDHPSASHLLMDDAGVMVEELTVRNYNGANLSVVGTTKNKDRMQTRQNQWHHVSHLVGGSGIGCSSANSANRDSDQAIPTAQEDVGDMPFTGLLGRKLPRDDQNETTEHLTHTENKEVAANRFSHGGIRTKLLPNSGFSEFFVKQN